MKKKTFLLGSLFTFIILFASFALAQEAGGAAEEAATGVPRMVLFQAINFLGLLIILYFLLRKKVGGYFAQRHDTVAAALTEARKIKAEAENKHQEYVIKIQELQREADSLLEQIKRDGEESKRRIIEEAHRLAQTIKEEAKRSAENEIEKARVELYDEVLERALEGARTLLHKSIADNDQRRLQKEFVEKIEAVQ